MTNLRAATRPADPARRTVLGLLAAAAAVAGFSVVRRGQAATPAKTAAKTGPVAIALFDRTGRALGVKSLPRVVRTDAQWRAQLSPLAYQVARKDDTERPFSGAYDKLKKPGVYRCVCCATALYDAKTKFDSGTGWPSFWQPIARGNVAEHIDRMFGMARTEVSCARCDAHLGHVFNDGPRPTGLRYCMNAVSLRFEAAA